MFKYFSLSFLFFVYLIPCNAQTKSKIEIDKLILQCTIDSTSTQAERQEDLMDIVNYSQEVGYEKGLAFAHLGLASINRESAVEISLGHISILDSLVEFGKTPFTDTLFVQYTITKGYILGASGNYSDQLSLYLKADSICKATENVSLQSFVNQHLSHFYYNREDYKNALIYMKALLEYYRDNSVESRYSYLNTLINIGSIYDKLQISDSTIKYVNLAIEKGLGGFQDLSFPYLLLGKSYLNNQDFKQAKDYESLVYKEQDTLYKYTIDGILAHQFSGDLATALNQLPNALTHYKIALTYSDSNQYDRGKINGNYNVLATQLKLQNDTKLHAFLEAYRNNKDSLYSRKSLELENQLLVQYETNKKELSLQKLKLTNERLNHKNQKQRNRIIVILFCLIIVTLIAILLIIRYRHKQNLINKKIESQKLQETILSKNLELSKKDLHQALENLESKSHLISQLKSDLQNKVNTPQNIDDIMNLLDQNYIDENNWVKIILNFDTLNDGFSKKIKQRFPNTTNNDIQLLILIKLGYSIKGIAEVNNITQDSVKKRKQRLLKKMEISNFKLLDKVG